MPTTTQLIEEALKEFFIKFTKEHPDHKHTGDPLSRSKWSGQGVVPENVAHWLRDKLETIATQSTEEKRINIIQELDELPTYGLDTNIHLDKAIEIVNENLAQPEEELND